jgi:AsmA family protein
VTARAHLPRRRLVWGVAAVLGALLLTLALLEWAQWPFLRAPLQRSLSNAAAVPVQFEGDFGLSLLSSRMQVQHLRVGPAAGIDVPHLVDATEVELDWRWRDLWRWRRGDTLRLQRLAAATLDANLVRL